MAVFFLCVCLFLLGICIGAIGLLTILVKADKAGIIKIDWKNV